MVRLDESRSKKFEDKRLLEYKETLTKAVRKTLKGHREEEVNDIVQDAWIKVATKVGTFRGESKLSTWVYTIGCNTAKNFLKKEKKNSEGDYSDTASQDEDNEDVVAQVHKDRSSDWTIVSPTHRLGGSKRLHEDNEELVIIDELIKAFDEISAYLREHERKGRNEMVFQSCCDYYELGAAYKGESLKMYVMRCLRLSENEYTSSRQAIQRACEALDYKEIYHYMLP